MWVTVRLALFELGLISSLTLRISCGTDSLTYLTYVGSDARSLSISIIFVEVRSEGIRKAIPEEHNLTW